MHTTTISNQTNHKTLTCYDSADEYLNNSDNYNDNDSDCKSNDYNNYESNYKSNNEEAPYTLISIIMTPSF